MSTPPIKPSSENPPVPLTLYSIVIPAHNEEESLPHTVRDIYAAMIQAHVPHEIVVVDDGSRDCTWAVLQELKKEIPTLAPVQNLGLHGFGRAVIFGLNQMKFGDVGGRAKLFLLTGNNGWVWSP